jgi:hypothetical protein
MCYEEAAARNPAIPFVEFSFVLRLFEPLVVAVQNLDVELIGFREVVQDSRDNQFVVVFADSEAVFSISQICVNPSKVRSVERIDRDGFLDEIEFVATNHVRFRTGSFVSRGPKCLAVLLDLLEKLVGPKVFQFDLDVFSDFFKTVDLALHLDGGDSGLGAVDDQEDGDLEERVY